ncbi:MAG: EamA family transporter [Candidatus Woesearchaeota archaeon]
MYAEILSLVAAALFGLNAIFLKRGYLHSSPLASNLVMTTVNVAAFWVISLLFVPLNLFLTKGVIFFAIGGLLGQALARTLQYKGIDKIGPPRNHTVLSTMSLFTAIFAMLILGERPGLPVLLGTLLIMAGVSLVMWEHKSALQKKYLLFPLLAAIIYGFVNIIQKSGLNITQNGIAGATVAVTSALFGLLVFTSATGKLKALMKLGKARNYFIAAGLINTIGFLLNFVALQKGSVTTIAPLVGTQPLFATLFTYLFLKDIDKVTWNVVLGAILAVAGVVAITAF